jgi:hypothetical protein
MVRDALSIPVPMAWLIMHYVLVAEVLLPE